MISTSRPGPLRLRAHQRTAVADLVSAFDRHRRLTFVSACGTGKTVTSAALAIRIARDASVLILVPTLELIGQSITAFDAAGRPGPHLAVCSDAELTRTLRGTRADETTTSPAFLAAYMRSGATVYATYASLGVIEAAHRDHGLAPWRLVVIDEAHRTSGQIGKPWARIHDDNAIPCDLRLYMTATPRILDEAGETIASMDDERIFGPVAHRLGFAKAISEGILADYRIAVPVLADAELAETIRAATVFQAPDAPAAEADDLALATALLHTVEEFGIRRVVSYHSRVAKARGFARAVQTASRITDSPAWAHAIWGKIPAAARRDLLHEFATGDGFRLLANSRLLGEGVDVPSMDAVVFADAKYSTIDTVQAIGRALRPSEAGKVATVVIPVFITPGENAESAVDNSAWSPLWKTLRALDAHDDRIGKRLREADAPGAQPGAQGGAVDRRADLSWLHVTGIPIPEDFALAVRLRLLDRKSAEWRQGFAAAKRYHARHGHVNAPQTYVDEEQLAYGTWLSWQRQLYRSGSLARHRAEALEALGVIWNPRATIWERNYALLPLAMAEHGHLFLPRNAVVGGVKLGIWLDNLRLRPEQVSPEHQRMLAELDPMWNPPWAPSWQRRYYELREHIKDTGSPDVPRTARTKDGRTVGEWVHEQRSHRDSLHPEQVRLLDELGFRWERNPHGDAWARGIEAAGRFKRRHSHLDVPQKYVDEEGFKLGVWVNNVRRRRETLSPDRIAALDALGMVWVNASRPTPHSPLFQAANTDGR